MKKNLLALFSFVFILGATNLFAQTNAFAFSQFTNTYTPLIGGTDVYGTTPWNNGSIVSFPIGFTFDFLGHSNDTIDMIPGIAAFPHGMDFMGTYTFFAALVDTGLSVSKSPVTYAVTGAVGNRILKIQTADAGFNMEVNAYGSYSSVVNFQAWFYELDNAIEVHMGPSTIVHPQACYLDSANPGPSIGVIELDTNQTTVYFSLMLAGNPSAPTQTVYTIASYPPAAMNGTPADGTVYRFAPYVSGINENEQVFGNVGLFPNPSNENATLLYAVKNSGEVNVVVTDMQGRVVLNDNLGMQSAGTNHYNVNTANLSSGFYFVTLVSGEQRVTQKLSVAH